MAAAIALVNLVGSAMDTPSGTVPVPSEHLRGRTLLGDHFEVSAPRTNGGGYNFQLPMQLLLSSIPSLSQKTTYSSILNGRLFGILDLKKGLPPNDEFMRGFQNGIERTSPKTGWTIEDFAFAPADIPLKDASYRFTCKATRTDGLVKYRFGYIGGVEKKYQFQYSDTSSGESPVFTKFVASFTFH